MTDYRVNLDMFEGPLDLLLHLIKKDDLDVYDIPIAFVLERYMEYLDSIKDLNIDIAGEFLLMAAELAHIKSRMLLPDDQAAGEEEEDGLDPRADLVRRLLEYQQFKEASETLSKRAMLGRDIFVPLAPERLETRTDGPITGDMFELVHVFSAILKKAPKDSVHDVMVDRISINERIYQIVDVIKSKPTVTLQELIGENFARFDVVITFLALLEMSRLHMVRVYQQSLHGPLYLQATMENVSEEDVLRLVEVEATGFEKKRLLSEGHGSPPTNSRG